MTPSIFELNSHPEFAKTYAYHFAISAKNDLSAGKVPFIEFSQVNPANFAIFFAKFAVGI